MRWTHPFTCVIAGPTQSGKTEFVKRFVRHVEDMVTPVPTKIIWSYGEWQPAYQSLLDKVDFVQGLPDLPLYSAEPLLLVIDDQMHGVDQRISSLFTKGSHHRKPQCHLHRAKSTSFVAQTSCHYQMVGSTGSWESLVGQRSCQANRWGGH